MTRDHLEEFQRNNIAALENVLEVARELLASHQDLVEVVDGLRDELASVSAQLATLKAGAPPSVPLPRRSFNSTNPTDRLAS